MNTIGRINLPEGIGYFLVVGGAAASETFLSFEDFLKAVAKADWTEGRRHARKIRDEAIFLQKLRALPVNYGLARTPSLPAGRRFGFTCGTHDLHLGEFPSLPEAVDAALVHHAKKKKSQGSDISEQPGLPLRKSTADDPEPFSPGEQRKDF